MAVVACRRCIPIFFALFVLVLRFSADAVAPAPALPVPNIATQVLLTDNSYGAKCLDGSPPHYYIRHAASPNNSTKWYLHIQGGGWCFTEDDCASRARTRLGSSLPKFGFNSTMDLRNIEGCGSLDPPNTPVTRWCGSLMSADPSINSMTHDWNAVLVLYCDGGSLTGNRLEPLKHNGENIYFHGFLILNAIIDDLIQNHQFSKATDVVVGGDSAGGLAVFLHIDHFRARLPETAHVVGVPDSGFFLDQGYVSLYFRSIFNFMNSTAGVHPDCVKAHPTFPEDCFVAEIAAPYIRTAVWAVQSQFDPAQPVSCGKEGSPSHDCCMNEFGQTLTSTFSTQFLSKNPDHGAWLYSCFKHCGGWQLGIAGVNAAEAFQEYYYGSSGKKVWQQTVPYPCQTCCDNP